MMVMMVQMNGKLIDSNMGIMVIHAPDFENPTDDGNNNTYVVVIKDDDDTDVNSNQTLTVTINNMTIE